VFPFEDQRFDGFDDHGVAHMSVGRLPHEDVGRRGRLLQASRDVDGVSRGEAVSARRVANHDLAGVTPMRLETVTPQLR
jgi:hypothetical protein